MTDLANLIQNQADQLLQHLAKDSSLASLDAWLDSKDFAPEVEAKILKHALFKKLNERK